MYSFLDKNAKRCKIRFFYNKTQKTAFVVFQEQHNAVNIFLGGYLYTIYILIQCTHFIHIYLRIIITIIVLNPRARIDFFARIVVKHRLMIQFSLESIQRCFFGGALLQTIAQIGSIE